MSSERDDQYAREFIVPMHSLMKMSMQLYESYGVMAGERGEDPEWADRRERLRGIG
jgi:hypothetical protein